MLIATQLQADDATVRDERKRNCSDHADESAGRHLLKKSAELIVIKRRWRPIEKPVVLAAVGDQLNLIFSTKVELTCKLNRTQQ